VLGLLVVTMTVSVGFSATLPMSSLEELTQEADLIVHGRVKELRPSSSDKDPFSTVLVLAVQEAWKQAPSPTLRLRLPHGSQSEITQAVPGLPTFQVGEEVIVFLVRDPDGEFEVLHGVHGKLTVQIDTQRGTAVVEDVSGTKITLMAFLNRLRQLTKSGDLQ
jgi:hypothetical protein